MVRFPVANAFARRSRSEMEVGLCPVGPLGGRKSGDGDRYGSTQRVHFERTPRIGMLSLKAINFQELRFVSRSRPAD